MALPQALSSLEIAGLLVGLPLGLFLLIALLVAVPGGVRGKGRYRPGLAWDAEPVWFNGPDDAAPETIQAAEPSRSAGGARVTW